jgi:hypothetical protein
MTRRWDIGPVLVGLGALLLLVSLFLRWYGTATAWDAYELVDLLLAALAIAGVTLATAALVPALELADRRPLPWVAGAAFVIVAMQLIDPPPLALGRSLAAGAWLGFAASVLMVVGTVLTFGRVSFAVAVEGRDPRRRVTAVDSRGQETGTHEALADPDPEPGPATQRAPRRDAPLLGRRDRGRTAPAEDDAPGTAGDDEDPPERG